jgi:hypothetical protein
VPAFTPCAELALPPIVTGTVGLLNPACWWPEPLALADAAGGAGIVVEFTVLFAVPFAVLFAAAVELAAARWVPAAVVSAFPAAFWLAFQEAPAAALPAVVALVPSS